MISRGRIVDISLIILMFSEMHVFSQVCIFDVFYKRRREKRGQREIQGAQNSGNPCAK